MELTCINLRDLFGDEFQVIYEESFRARRERTPDPWLLILLCKHGHIYPMGGEWLGAATTKHGSVASRLRLLDCVTVVQDGSDGINLKFHIRDFDRVAPILQPRRRRRLAPEHRERLAAMGRRNFARSAT